MPWPVNRFVISGGDVHETDGYIASFASMSGLLPGGMVSFRLSPGLQRPCHASTEDGKTQPANAAKAIFGRRDTDFRMGFLIG
jgi:hypothetical protein